jgi:hypothetical protein
VVAIAEGVQMKTVKNTIGWSVMISCVLAAGCTLDSGAPEGEAAENIAETSEELEGNQFGFWSVLPASIGQDPLRFAFGAAITSRSSGDRFVYAVNDANSHMMVVAWSDTSGWGTWADIGGEFNSKPGATTWYDGSRHNIFTVGRGKWDNRYWYATQIGHSLSGWSQIPTGTFDSAPSAARILDKIVVCGRAGPQIWCATNPIVGGNLSSWTPWVKAVDGAFFDADPGLANDLGRSRLRLVGRKPNTGHYWYSSSYDGVNWENFTEIPDAFFYSGAAVSGRWGEFDYFGQGGGTYIWQTSTSQSTGFQPIPNLQVITSPAAHARSGSQVDVIGLHSSKLLLINTWQG